MARTGDVVTVLCKPEDATNAGFIVYVQIKTRNDDGSSIEKTLGWIRNDGSSFIEDKYAGTEAGLPRPSVQHSVHKVYTSEISFVTKEIKNVIDVTEKIENAIKDVKPKGIKDLNKKYFDGIFPNNVGW